MGDIREGIQSQFSALGFEVADAVLDRCVEICILHNEDEESFVETWAAYSITNLNGEAPTMETLAQFERKEFTNTSSKTSSSRQPITPLPVYNKTPKSNKKPADGWNTLDSTPKGPKNEGLVARQLSNSASRSTFSPASFSPLSTPPSGTYSTRESAGEVVCEFVERTPGGWKGKERIPLTVAAYRADEVLSSKTKLMMEPLLEKADVLNDVIERVGMHLIDTNNLPEPSSNSRISAAEMVYVGRVCCDSNERLNPSSVLLEGSRRLCLGQCVALDLSRLSHFALFPGQIIAVEGVNPTGETLVVTKLYYSAPLPLSPQMPRLSSTLEMVIAAGPFTQTDSLAYEPLEDLMRYVKNHNPHILVLIGPLVDLRQSQLTSGALAESYQDLYTRILNGIMDQLKGSWTQVVVVASADDAVCLPVYPTPPPPTITASLHQVSDPAILSINGLVIALTATDTLMHLGKEEISFGRGSGDRLGRLASHLIGQQHLYPLHPPSSDITVDTELWDLHASLPATPHIIVTPSNFRYFIKNVHGCLVVNPEHLAKGKSGGTFARLEVEPPVDDIWSPASHISAQIVKI